MYFIDDLNMPYVDKYDTQSAIELARQMVDYRGWCAGAGRTFSCRPLVVCLNLDCCSGPAQH